MSRALPQRPLRASHLADRIAAIFAPLGASGVCERCGAAPEKRFPLHPLEDHKVCHNCEAWILKSAVELTTAAGRGAGLPLIGGIVDNGAP